MTISILQFGTSRFLQAHADLFVGQARAQGQDVGRIGVIQTTNSPRSRARVEAFKSGDPYPVKIRGRMNRNLIDETVVSDSIETGFHASQDWSQILDHAPNADVIISNTGDGSYRFDRQDIDSSETPPSFPGRLLMVLKQRYRSGASPSIILPCELKAQGNGATLKATIHDLIAQRGEDRGFREWLFDGCFWLDTLVDRIVSGDIEPVGSVTEPFALWAIASQPGLTLPFSHEAVNLTDNLQDFVRLKLYLLNVAHMVLVGRWEADGRRYDFCRQAMDQQDIRTFLEETYETELLPTFERAGMGRQARQYVARTLERFENPFLDHKFTDMIVDYPNKVRERIGSFLDWSDSIGMPPHQKKLRGQLQITCGDPKL